MIVPTQEPERVRAGTTWQWRREDLTVDFPATAWTLKYWLKNATQHFEIVATADGAMFAISVLPANNSAVIPGNYRMIGAVEDGGAANRFEVYNEEIAVDAAYANTTVIDDRTHARKVVEAIEALIEGRASKDQEEITIGHTMLKRIPLKDLREFRDYYRGKVREEDLRDAAAQGRGGAKVLGRF